MKKLFLIALLFTICLLLCFFKYFSKVITNVLISFYYNTVPLLFSVLLLLYIFSFSGGITLLLKKTHLKNKTKFILHKLIIIILGIICGGPTLASLLYIEEKRGVLTRSECFNILSSFSSPSLTFIISLLRLSSFSLLLKTSLLIPLFVECFVYIVYEKSSCNKEYNFKIESSASVFQDAIIKSHKTIILMTGSIVIFTLLSSPLSLILKGNLLYVSQGLLEFSYPLLMLFKSNSLLALFETIIILSFSSLSLLIQTKLIYPSISSFSLIKRRLLITVLSSLLFGLFFVI